MNRYMTFWPRFWAGCIDGFALGVISMGVYFPLSLLLGLAIGLSGGGNALSTLVGAFLISFLSISYSVGLHAAFGQTFGKMAMSIKVLNLGEERIPTLREALLRDSGHIVLSSLALALMSWRAATGQPVSLAPQPGQVSLLDRVLDNVGFVWFALEILSMLTNEKRRALHDYIAGTVVVRAAKSAPPAP